MYKLIALDLDGTLLNSQKQISSRTKQAIAAARQHGVKVVLASGRPIEGMTSKLDELAIDGHDEFVVCYNGSIVKELANQSVIHTAILDGKAAKQVAALAKKLGLSCHAFSQEFGLITPQVNQYTQLEADINGLTITEMSFDKLEDSHPIIKTMIVGDPVKLTEAIATLPQDLHEQFTIVQSAPFFLEFLNPNSNKGVGIEAIAKQMGIDSSQVIAMGDAENDHHMIEYAGLGVAMANAMDETKQIANHITVSNDEDGVAVVIEQYVLSQYA